MGCVCLACASGGLHGHHEQPQASWESVPVGPRVQTTWSQELAGSKEPAGVQAGLSEADLSYRSAPEDDGRTVAAPVRLPVGPGGMKNRAGNSHSALYCQWDIESGELAPRSVLNLGC